MNRERHGIGGRHKVCRVVQGLRRRRVVDPRGRLRRIALIDLAYEPKPAFVQRADESLIDSAISERTTSRADARAQRRIRDDAPLPDRINQLVFANRPIAIADEVDEEIEHLRLDLNKRSGAPQLMARDIDLEIRKAEIQGGVPGRRPLTSPPRAELS